MIIKSLRATNVLKYGHLELTNIPSKGLIGICGPNEAGKTSVVETICFALFGRTFGRSEDKLEKIIRWGEPSCSVELEFTGNDDQTYRVIRSLDERGVHGAQLYRSGQSEPFVNGPQTVQDNITQLCGFDFAQYLDSLYLAQMEISHPHAQSETIKEIAGAVELEDTAAELRTELVERRNHIENIENRIAALQGEIEELDIREDAIPTLKAQQDQLAHQIEGHQASLAELETTSKEIQNTCQHIQQSTKPLLAATLSTPFAAWKERTKKLDEATRSLQVICSDLRIEAANCPGQGLQTYLNEIQEHLVAFTPVREAIESHRRQLRARLGETDAEYPISSLPDQRSETRSRLQGTRSFRFLSLLGAWISVLLALAAWGSWWWLAQNPELEVAGFSRAWLENHLAAITPNHTAWLEPAALILTGLAALFIVLSALLKRRVRNSRKDLSRLDKQLNEAQNAAQLLEVVDQIPFPEAVTQVRRLGDDNINLALREYVEGPGAVFYDAQALASVQERLSTLANQCLDESGNLREIVAKRMGAITQQIDQCHTDSAKLEAQIEEQKTRRETAQTLEASIQDANDEIRQLQDQLRIHQYALELTEGTCRSVYRRFNRTLTKYTGEVMPKLTEGRYSQMQIDNDLQVRVYSQEKNDLADIDEFSSGTQRQIMLAVRLAMAKALVEATEQSHQFVILDEPFAFFDRERIRSALKTLPELDKHITQIWIISQEFEFRGQFKLRVECTRESDELIVAGE